ncbi:MAG: 2,3-bisphosphoglycerate-independent phosphoglycerate mutase [Pyrinomonadaceae bacterium]
MCWSAIATGAFMENAVITRAFAKAKAEGSAVHMIGLVSDGDVHSSTESLFALLRLAKRHRLTDVSIHAILDGLDVPPRSADVYMEALEIKLADIGLGRIASLCGRFFAMDSNENWERTARAFTMLVHAEGERSRDAVGAVRNSFLRGISDEFIAPIVIEGLDGQVKTVKNGDLVVFFNHRPETMRQLVRALCIPENAGGGKPFVETVCMTEYDRAFNLPAAFRQESEKNVLTSVLSDLLIPHARITESARLAHLTYFFDGGTDDRAPGEQIVLPTANPADLHPESQSFKITDGFRRSIAASPDGVFVVNIPAADLMAATGDFGKTVAAVQYVDTCLGGICERVRQMGGITMITSTHGNCEEMPVTDGKPNAAATANPVPFHYIDDIVGDLKLRDDGSLEDVAPTILSLLNIEKPAEMTGSDIRSS